MFLFRRLFSTISPEAMSAAKTKAQEIIDGNAVGKCISFPVTPTLPLCSSKEGPSNHNTHKHAQTSRHRIAPQHITCSTWNVPRRGGSQGVRVGRRIHTEDAPGARAYVCVTAPMLSEPPCAPSP